MTKRIIFTADGSASIVVLAKGTDPVAEATKLGLTDYEIVDTASIPSDRTFRNAWVHDTTESDNKIGVNMPVARDISLERLRTKRDEELAKLDVEYTIATREGNPTTELDTKRTALLDATETLKALDVNEDGIVSVEEAAGILVPLELLEV